MNRKMRQHKKVFLATIIAAAILTEIMTDRKINKHSFSFKLVHIALFIVLFDAQNLDLDSLITQEKEHAEAEEAEEETPPTETETS